MERGRRIPLHDHSGFNSGGLIDTTVTQTIVTGDGGNVSFASPVAIGTALVQGVSAAAAAADHVHTNAYLGTVVVSGTAAAGYLLTADSAGSASWQSAAGTAAASVVWYDEGAIAGTAGIVNLVGSSGTVAVAGGTATITLSSSGGGGSVVFYDEGVVAGTAAILNVVGSSGTVAVSGGTATLTLSASGGSAALVWLQTQTASGSATLDFTGFVSGTYTNYLFILQNIVPATNNVDLWMRVSTDGGSTWKAGASDYNSTLFAFAATGQAGGGGTNDRMMVRNTGEMSNTSSRGGVSGEVFLFNPASSSIEKRIVGHFSYWTTQSVGSEMRGQYLASTAVDGFRFLFSSGNIASGTIRVYGIANS